jgi:hypothetical protein
MSSEKVYISFQKCKALFETLCITLCSAQSWKWFKSPSCNKLNVPPESLCILHTNEFLFAKILCCNSARVNMTFIERLVALWGHICSQEVTKIFGIKCKQKLAMKCYNKKVIYFLSVEPSASTFGIHSKGKFMPYCIWSTGQ